MIEITIDDHEVKAAIKRLMQCISDMSPVVHDIGETVVERTKQRFAGSRAPDGTPWAPNAPATIEAYLHNYDGTQKNMPVLFLAKSGRQDQRFLIQESIIAIQANIDPKKNTPRSNPHTSARIVWLIMSAKIPTIHSQNA